MARTQAEIDAIFSGGTKAAPSVTAAAQRENEQIVGTQNTSGSQDARTYQSVGGDTISNATTAKITPVVVSSSTAQKNLDEITAQHAKLLTDIENQKITLVNQKAQADAATAAKTQMDTSTKAAADKAAIDKQNADAKTAALRQSGGDAPVDKNPVTKEVPYTGNAEWKTITRQDGTTQIVSKGIDGSYVPISQSEIGIQDKLNQQTKEMDEYTAASKNVSDTITQIQNGIIPLNAGQMAQVQGLQQSFNQLTQQQNLQNISASNVANIRGFQKGAAEYDPSFQVNTIGTIVTAGANKIADLNIKMASAVGELTESFKTNNIKAIKDSWDVYNTAAGKRQTTLEKTIESAQARIKSSVEAQTKIREDINNIVKDAAKNGASPETQHAISRSSSVAAAVEAAGEYLQTGAGIVGEYAFYKKDMANRGLTPLSFDEYQTRDANRKLKASAAINSAGLTTAGTQVALKLSDDYEARSKDYYTQRDAYNRVLSSAKDPSAAGDLALIFNYMKTLDPGSTVREGEFATAQNSGSAFQIVGGLYNKVISGERLTDTQRKDFVKRADLLFNGAQKQQDSVVKEFTARAKQYDVPSNLVVRDTNATGNNDPVQQELDAKDHIIKYGNEHPEVQKSIISLVTEVDPVVGRPLTYLEALQVLSLSEETQ